MANVIGRLYATGYTALRARLTELDDASDNLANVNTPAFKERHASFQAALGLQAEQIERRGVDLSSSVPDFDQGPIQTTGQTWDLAIDGPGFFTLRMPDGSRGYTRLGVFHLDGASRLVNEQGLQFDPPIAIPAGVENLTVDSGGLINATLNGVPQALGRLQLANFRNPEGLLDQGSGIFVPSAASGDVMMGAPGQNGTGTILSGAIEGSNVNTSQQMISLIQTQRAYGLTLRALQISDQMAELTNQLQG